MLNKDNYYKLLDSIKKTKLDENYKPKQYSFGLKSFNKKEDEKRENQ